MTAPMLTDNSFLLNTALRTVSALAPSVEVGVGEEESEAGVRTRALGFTRNFSHAPCFYFCRVASRMQGGVLTGEEPGDQGVDRVRLGLLICRTLTCPSLHPNLTEAGFFTTEHGRSSDSSIAACYILSLQAAA